MPHEPNHQSSLIQPDYTPSSLLMEEKEDYAFNVFMPNFLSDMFKSGYNSSLVANAIHMLGEDGIKYDLSIGLKGLAEFDLASADIDVNKFVPDFLKKHTLSDDYSEYQEDFLFDVGSQIVAIVADLPAIYAASRVSGGGPIGPALGGRVTSIAGTVGRQAPKLKQAIGVVQQKFKDFGVGDGVRNKVAKSLYETLSNPGNIIKQGNTLGIYSGTHNLVGQKAYSEDGASWSNKVDYLSAMDAAVAGWKGGAAFPIGAAAGKPLVGGTLSKFAPGTRSAAVLQKVGGEAGDILGGGYAFVVPEYGVMPDGEALAHSIGIVAGLKGIHAPIDAAQKRYAETNKAFRGENLTEAEIQKAQDIIGMRIETEVTNSNSLFNSQGVEVVKTGITAKGNAKYQEVLGEGNLGPTKYMKNELFHEKFSIEKSDVLPADVLRTKIEEVATELGALTPEARAELYYSGIVPKNLKKGETGLSRLDRGQQYELLKDLKAEKIARDYILDVAVSKLPPPRIPVIGKMVDILRTDVVNLFPFGRDLISRMNSNYARLARKSNPDPFAVDMWRKFNALPSKIQAIQGRILTDMGVMDFLTNKKIDGNKLTQDVLMGNMDNPVAKSVRDTIRLMATNLREKGVIPKEVKLELEYLPHYLRDSVREALSDLNNKIATESFKFENREQYLEYIKEQTTDKGVNLSKAEVDMIAKVMQTWMNSTKSVGAKKYIEQIISNNTVLDGKKKVIQWDKAFKEINQNINNLEGNAFHNFSKGRSTEIKYDVEKGGFDVDIFETNAIKNLEKYTRDYAEAMAQVESFGPNFSTFKDVLRRLEAEGKDIEVTTLQDMYDATYNYKKFWTKSTGGRMFDVTRDVQKGVVNIIEGINNFASGLLVSWGYGPIYNATQPMISYMATVGYTPSVKNAYRYLFSKDGKALRKQRLDETGVNLAGEYSLFELIHGAYSKKDSFHRRFAEWSSKRSPLTGFLDLSGIPGGRLLTMKGSTQRVHEAATLAGFEAIETLIQTAKTGRSPYETMAFSKKVKREMEIDTFGKQEPTGTSRIERNKAWAREKLLIDFNIRYDGSPLSRKQVSEGALFFADKTQLKRNIATESFYMSHPQSRGFFRLKSFLIKQTRLYHELVNSHLKYGNTAPLLRTVIAGATGTQLIRFKEKLEETLLGQDVVSRQDSADIVDGLVAIGMGGMGLDLSVAEDKNRELLRTISPIAYEQFMDVAQDINAYFTKGIHMDLEKQLEAAPTELSRYFGGPMKSIVRRFEAYENKKDRLTFIKGLKEKELIRMYLKAQDLESDAARESLMKEVQDKAREWNTAYPGFGVYIGDDMGSIVKMVADYKLKELKKEKELKGIE